MLDPVVIKALKSIVGPDNLFTGPEELTVYAYDALGRQTFSYSYDGEGNLIDMSEYAYAADDSSATLTYRDPQGR